MGKSISNRCIISKEKPIKIKYKDDKNCFETVKQISNVLLNSKIKSNTQNKFFMIHLKNIREMTNDVSIVIKKSLKIY